jgi:hypothetical protein
MSAHKKAAPAGGSFITYRRDDVEAKTMKNNEYSTDTANQRKRILDRLQSSPLTTLQARKELDIMHPAARVQELKQRGHNIVTHWTTEFTGKARHRVASYVLFADPSLSLGDGHD